MSYEFTRLEMLIGEVGIEKLSSSTLVVFGIGGVGSYAVEALARSAIGNLILVDFDMISESNINRQIHSLEATVGKNKVDVMKERIESINSNCNVTAVQKIINEENIEEFFRDKKIDFVLDAIDMMRAKISLIEYCYENNLNIISSMGFGNKMNPEVIEIANIYDTNTCPLARTLRRILKRKGIKRLPVVYSREIPKVPNKSIIYKEEIKTEVFDGKEIPKKITPGSNSFVPPTAGMIMASYVVRKILE